MTSVSPDTKQLWRTARGPVTVGAVVLVAAIVITLLTSKGNTDAADPDSVAPNGSRAVARLLQGYGVQIVKVETLQAAKNAVAGDTTLLVTRPDWVGADEWKTLRGKDTILITPTEATLDAIAPTVSVQGQAKADARNPDCDFGPAKAAGRARIGTVAYQARNSCYEGTLVPLDGVTVLGDATPLSNEVLDEDGNAALALRLLGQHQKLVWYLPSLADATASGGQRSIYDLIPPGWGYAVIEVVIAVLLFMLWRARRLGPVVTEPLPVVVRAAETTEGRARLYRRAKATDHAADALRRAALNRLIPMLGLTSEAAVVDRIAERTGRPGAEVHAILYGPAPATEQALVHLADALDALINEVRTT
ncbi:DUF4350 domain-containing protein [Actinocrispum sp. NPDC049592]|uniref:DUF4350 domain-containing protein n=1 Tax=Actinocrispum sp. NPDC049592 TaxID=3154835 RepID=UPI003438DE1E